MRVLLLLLIVACGNSKPSGGGNTNKPFNAADRQSCKVTEECTLVEACCGCNAAGKRVAIRKDAVAAYDAGRSQRCGDTQCAQAISSHSSCDAEASCIDGVCKVMSHMGGVSH